MNHPWITCIHAQLNMRIHSARHAPSRGASAVEWVIITAIVAGVALTLAFVIQDLVAEWQQKIQESGPK